MSNATRNCPYVPTMIYVLNWKVSKMRRSIRDNCSKKRNKESSVKKTHALISIQPFLVSFSSRRTEKSISERCQWPSSKSPRCRTISIGGTSWIARTASSCQDARRRNEEEIQRSRRTCRSSSTRRTSGRRNATRSLRTETEIRRSRSLARSTSQGIGTHSTTLRGTGRWTTHEGTRLQTGRGRCSTYR